MSEVVKVTTGCVGAREESKQLRGVLIGRVDGSNQLWYRNRSDCTDSGVEVLAVEDFGTSVAAFGIWERVLLIALLNKQ